MLSRSFRNTILMVGGALAIVQGLVTVLEHRAQPASVDPAFFSQVNQAQQLATSSRGFPAAVRTQANLPAR